MSFSGNFKDEIVNTELPTEAEKFAFLSAVIKQIGSVHISKNVFNIQIESEYCDLIMKIVQVIKSLYDQELCIKTYKESNIHSKKYLLELPRTIAEQLMQKNSLFGYGSQDNTATQQDEQVIKAFLFGIVISSVNITVPTPTKNDASVYEGGYTLEIRFVSEANAEQVQKYFDMFDIHLKLAERSDYYSLYIRDSETISDFMAFFGASNCVIEINNIIVARLVRNQTNRQQNCEMANIDKAINAGQKQYLAIKLIDEKIGLESLSDKLREIAIVRLQNPDYSLDQIAETVGGGISKSGINHRFRKIIEIASALGDN